MYVELISDYLTMSHLIVSTLLGFLTGLAAAGYSPNIQIFVAETCQVLLLAPPLLTPVQAHHRGWMAGLTVPIMSLGILTVYLLGR